jgi:phenylacetate-CoA ligase
MKVALPTVTRALVSGEAFPPSLRDWLADAALPATSATRRPTSG